MEKAFDQYEVWFVTGAQLLYGGDAVVAVDAHSNEMVNGLNESGKLPVKVVYKGTANSSKEVEAVFKAANNDEKCIGVITWMHTFSPAKMWIHGLQQLKKPLLHLHTQFNKEIPWDTMDMDFMNLNQSAHGDREFGHICARMRVRRKVVVGYWKDENTLSKIAVWMRVCAAWADSQDMLILRFGDQMNNVAVTDGDKVEAEQRMGYHVDYCPVSELMSYHKEVKDEEVEALVKTYFNEYDHDAELEDKASEAEGRVTPQMKGAYHWTNLRPVFPEVIADSLEEGIRSFDQKIKGYADADTVLSGVESRTSSPVRILRDETLQSSVRGLYPCGEGAGYAGGITSAAMDGLKTAEAISRVYRPFDISGTC